MSNQPNRRDFLRMLGAGGAVAPTSPQELFAQPQNQGGSDLVQKVFGTYEGLRSAGVLPSYQRDRTPNTPESWIIRLDPATLVRITNHRNFYDIDIERDFLDAEGDFRKYAGERDIKNTIKIRAKEENGALSAYDVWEYFFNKPVKGKDDKSSDNTILSMSQRDNGLEISAGRGSVSLPNATIPAIYTKFATAVYQGLQAQTKGK